MIISIKDFISGIIFLRLFQIFSQSAAVQHPAKRSRTRRQRKSRDKMLFFIFTKYALCVNYNGKRARNQSVWYFSVVLFIAPSLVCWGPEMHYHSRKSVDGGAASEGDGDTGWFQPDWWTEAFNYAPFMGERSPLLHPAAHHLHFALIPFVRSTGSWTQTLFFMRKTSDVAHMWTQDAPFLRRKLISHIFTVLCV